jgi:hypothetical protein
MDKPYACAFEFRCPDGQSTLKRLIVAETPDRTHVAITIEEHPVVVANGNHVEHTTVLLTAEQWDALTMLKHGDIKVDKSLPVKTPENIALASTNSVPASDDCPF